MEKTDLAYAAGLVDGEAYVGIKKSKPSNGSIADGYHERVQIRMVDEPAIAFIANLFGGTYYKESPSVASGRPLYCYQVSDKKAAAMLRAILPYMRVKKDVAEVVLKLRNRKDKPHRSHTEVECANRWGQTRTVRRSSLSDYEIQERSMLYLECKRLNKTGREV